MDEENSTASKSPALIPALSMLGVGVGVIALILGIVAMAKVGDTASEMNDKIEKAAALSLEMKKVSDRLDALALQVEDLKSGGGSKVTQLAKQTQDAIEKIGTILNENRKLIEENRNSIEEVAKRASGSKTAKAVKSEEATANQTANAPEQNNATQSAQQSNAEMITYKIQSGDTFAKLAGKYKVSLDSILRANPNVLPSRLKVGQEISIPKN